MGQRFFSKLLMVTLVLIGALLGFEAGSFPMLEDGTTVNPDLINEVFIEKGTPLLAVLYLAKQFLALINARVATGQLKAGNLKALAYLREFWVYVVGLVLSFLQLAGITLNGSLEVTQTIIVDFVLLAIGVLLGEQQYRSSGQSTSMNGGLG